MNEIVRKVEHTMTVVLIGLLAIIVVLATVELAVTLARDVAAPPVLFPGIDKLLDIFGKVLLVLIGIELLETMRSFAARGVVRAEVVLTVAMIAMARRIIVLEADRVSSTAMLGIAALVAALALAYRVVVPPALARTTRRSARTLASSARSSSPTRSRRRRSWIARRRAATSA